MFKYLKACVGAVIAITSTLSMAGCNPKEEDSQQPTKYGSVPVMYCNYQFNQFYSEMCFKNIDYYDRIHGNPMSSHYVDEGNPVFSENEEKFREDLIYAAETCCKSAKPKAMEQNEVYCADRGTLPHHSSDCLPYIQCIEEALARPDVKQCPSDTADSAPQDVIEEQNAK